MSCSLKTTAFAAFIADKAKYGREAIDSAAAFMLLSPLLRMKKTPFLSYYAKVKSTYFMQT